MELTFDATMFWLLAAVQFSGAAGLVASRLGEKWGDRQGACQLMFFAAMMLVAAATIVSLWVDSSTWAISGTTLSVMVIGGTLDCGGWDQSRSAR